MRRSTLLMGELVQSLIPTTVSVAFCTLLHATGACQSVSEEEELSASFGDRSTISIATGSPQPLRRAPAVATVITAADIAAKGATHQDEVLETVPGVHVSRSHNFYVPLYLFRGIASELNPQTLVLQNGVPMTTIFAGNRGIGWGGMPLEHVSRIEIIRGPGSALYGADAYAGVINIITKSAAEIGGTELGLRAGSFDSRDAWVLHGGKLGGVDVAAYLRAGRTDGQRRVVGADAQSGLDTLFGTSASLAPGPVNTGVDSIDGGLDFAVGKWRARLGYKLRDNLGSGAGTAAALDPVGQQRTERMHADIALNDVELAPHWRLTLSGSFLRYVQQLTTPVQLFPPGAFGGSFPQGMSGAPNTWERQLRLSAVANYGGWKGRNVRLGIGHDDLDLYRTQEFKNFTLITEGPATGVPIPLPSGQIAEFPVEQSFMLPQRRRVDYVYVQDEWTFQRDWTLTTGVRHDRYSDFGGTTNPRVALVWDASLTLTGKLLYGRAFRAPSFTETYSINNPVARGNRELKPETIDTLEGALQWQAAADAQLKLNLFSYRMKNIIRATDTENFTKTYNNVGAQRGKGLELEANWDPLHSLRLAAHYSYQRSIDRTTDHDAGYAPTHRLFLRSDLVLPGSWLGSAQVTHVADRRRTAGDNRPPVADYTTLDLSMRLRGERERWELGLSVRNAFNADVREPSIAPGQIPNDLPMAPRALRVELSYKL